MTKNLLSLGGCAFAAFLFIFSFSSCHDESVENVSEIAYRHAYEDNFVKTFGEVNPNQTWDFSTYGKKYLSNNTETRASGYQTIASDDGNYYVDDQTIAWLDDNLPEHGFNSSQVQSFVLSTDEVSRTFDVAYIYQGENEPKYDLYYVIKPLTGYSGSTTEKMLFSKGEVEISNDNGNTYNAIGTSTRTASTIGAQYVRSRVETITVPPHSFIYFYLRITATSTSPNQPANRWGYLDDKLSSIDEPAQIGLVNIPKPTNIDSGNDTYVLVCEDYCQVHLNVNAPGASIDYNDIAFLLSGDLPDKVEEEEKEFTISKRYMIEDLYGYDYDFNDIVVDVTQTIKKKIQITTNTQTGHTDNVEISSTTSQSATVQRLCGTLPFQIKVGGETFGQVTDPTDATLTATQLARSATDYGGKVTVSGSATGINPAYTRTITGWNPSTNNISAYIWTRGTAPELPATTPSSSSSDGLWTGPEGIWVSTFPEAGDVPYIIAVDQDVNWMPERTHIPEEWLGGDMTTPNATTTN